MITIGIDAIEIERFAHWQHFAQEKLDRIFSAQEIDYCLSVPTKAAERFAVRFAAKEAFFKAISTISKQPLSLLKICKHCEIVKDSLNRPQLKINWTALKIKAHLTTISITHTKTTALAVVLLD